MEEEVKNTYGDKIRIRVCGVCIRNDSILLIQHEGIGKQGSLWSPPGGGIAYGESCKKALVREFKEETSLDIKVKSLMLVNEYIKSPLHA
ncbi:MAG: NUDIX domain-containing protein, partial [Fulvivirga sp.]|nr:NUDIX domain-containing protein [Fulvivirga sp.]